MPTIAIAKAPPSPESRQNLRRDSLLRQSQDPPTYAAVANAAAHTLRQPAKVTPDTPLADLTDEVGHKRKRADSSTLSTEQPASQKKPRNYLSASARLELREAAGERSSEEIKKRKAATLAALQSRKNRPPLEAVGTSTSVVAAASSLNEDNPGSQMTEIVGDTGERASTAQF